MAPHLQALQLERSEEICLRRMFQVFEANSGAETPYEGVNNVSEGCMIAQRGDGMRGNSSRDSQKAREAYHQNSSQPLRFLLKQRQAFADVISFPVILAHILGCMLDAVDGGTVEPIPDRWIGSRSKKDTHHLWVELGRLRS